MVAKELQTVRIWRQMKATEELTLCSSPYKELICSFLLFCDILTVRGCSKKARDALSPAATIVWRRAFAELSTVIATIYQIQDDKKTAPVPYDPLFIVTQPEGAALVEDVRKALKLTLSAAGASHALVAACRYGRLHTAQWLASHLTFAEVLPNGSATDTAVECLVAACENDDITTIKWIVDHFAIKSLASCGGLLLHAAAAKGALLAIKWVVDAARICSPECVAEQLPAVKRAAEGGHLEAVRWMLAAFKVSRKDSTLVFPIFSAALVGGRMNVIKWLTKEGFATNEENIEQTDIEQFLSHTCTNGHTAAVAWIYDTWGLEAEKELLVRFFRVACVHGYLELVRWFLTKVPCTKTSATDRDCALIRGMCSNGSAEIVDLLCRAGEVRKPWRHLAADINKLCEKGHLSVLIVLKERFVIKLAEKTLALAVQCAAISGHFGVVKWLVALFGQPPVTEIRGLEKLWCGRSPEEMNWLHKNKLFTHSAIHEAFIHACSENLVPAATWLYGAQYIDVDWITELKKQALKARNCGIVHLLCNGEPFREPPPYRKPIRITAATSR